MPVIFSKLITQLSIAFLLIALFTFAYLQFMTNRAAVTQDITSEPVESELVTNAEVTPDIQVVVVEEVSVTPGSEEVIEQLVASSPESIVACADKPKAAECSFITDDTGLFGNCHEPTGETELACIPLQVN